MANQDRPTGLTPARTLQGLAYNGQGDKFYIPATDATAVFIGDAVNLAGSADANGVATIKRAAAGEPILGVVLGVEVNADDLTNNYRLANTAAYVYVSTDPNLLYTMQEDGAGGALAAANTSNVIDLVAGAGSTISGRSGMEIDSSTAGTASGQLRLWGLVQADDNEFGTNAVWLVQINEHELAANTGV